MVCLICISCEKETVEPLVPIKPSVEIEGLIAENYPNVDGSTSVEPLQRILACKLLKVNYNWINISDTGDEWAIYPDDDKLPDQFFNDRVKTSQTHQAFINLIDKETDMILSARSISEDEQVYADSQGITLIETPIALDAFIMLTHPTNKVSNLTTKQIQDIYTTQITNWKELGGNDANITAYIRNANSGSQELMESLIMKKLNIPDWTTELTEMLPSMLGVFHSVKTNATGLGYSIYYYKEMIVREKNVKTLAIEGVFPDKETISNKTYPYTTPVYAIIRSDLDHSSMAYKLYELLLTEKGKSIIEESGYIPYE